MPNGRGSDFQEYPTAVLPKALTGLSEGRYVEWDMFSPQSVIPRGRSILVLAVVILALTPRGGASGGLLDPFESFFYNDCQPMDLAVEQLPPDAARIGLTEEAIQAAVESRLRSAQLYDPDTSPYLDVNVNMLGSDFKISLEYNRLRWLSESSFGISLEYGRFRLRSDPSFSYNSLRWLSEPMAITWGDGFTPQVRTPEPELSASLILSRISKLMDLFLEAC